MKMVQMWTVQEVVDLIKRHRELFGGDDMATPTDAGKYQYWIDRDGDIFVVRPYGPTWDDEASIADIYCDVLGEWKLDTWPGDHEIDKVVAIIKRQVSDKELEAKRQAGQLDLL